MSLRQLGSESVTVDSTAGGVGITSALVTRDVILAVLHVETAQLRYNCKNAPTAAGTEGSPVADPGDRLELWGQPDILAFRAIRTGGVSAVLRVQLFGAGG